MSLRGTNMVMDRDMGMISVAIQLHQAIERQRKLGMKVYKKESLTLIYIASKKN